MITSELPALSPVAPGESLPSRMMSSGGFAGFAGFVGPGTSVDGGFVASALSVAASTLAFALWTFAENHQYEPPKTAATTTMRAPRTERAIRSRRLVFGRVMKVRSPSRSSTAIQLS